MKSVSARRLTAPPERLHEWDAEKGEVFVCCTTDEDCHRVSCGSDIPCVGIHVYGADIGVMERHSYDTETGEMKAFVSGWG
jgi:predicted metal-dependent enzyme (double-stranded beta helix superfamily)